MSSQHKEARILRHSAERQFRHRLRSDTPRRPGRGLRVCTSVVYFFLNPQKYTVVFSSSPLFEARVGASHSSNSGVRACAQASKSVRLSAKRRIKPRRKESSRSHVICDQLFVFVLSTPTHTPDARSKKNNPCLDFCVVSKIIVFGLAFFFSALFSTKTPRHSQSSYY